MLSRNTPGQILSLCFLLLLAGCGDDATGPSGTPSAPSVRLAANIDASSGPFEVSSEPAPDHPGFILRGSNVEWDPVREALRIDFTIQNRSRRVFPEPVRLVFVAFQPPGTTIQNPDNGVEGPGATIGFEFSNDDAQWTPLETSFPRTIYFERPEGENVGFVAELRFGPDDTDGISIGDHVHAKGAYAAAPDRLVAAIVSFEADDDDDSGYGGDDRGRGPRGSLRGPATAVDLDAGVLYLMGTPITGFEAETSDDDANADHDPEPRDGEGDRVCPHPSLADVRVGNSVRVDPSGRLRVEEFDLLAGRRIQCWNGNRDRVKGIVEEVRRGVDGRVAGFLVLDTWVEVTPATDFEVERD